MKLLDRTKCPECSRLREHYRRITRNELDLAILADQATIRNDPAALEELRSSQATVSLARAGASQDILDHENSHIRQIAMLAGVNRQSEEESNSLRPSAS